LTLRTRTIVLDQCRGIWRRRAWPQCGDEESREMQVNSIAKADTASWDHGLMERVLGLG